MTEIQHAGFPLLAALQLLPLAGTAATWLLRERAWAPRLAQAVAAVELGLAFLLVRALDHRSGAMQLAERLDLPGPLDYHAAADGVTALFVLLSALLTLLVSVYAGERRLQDQGALLAVVLAVEAVLMSALASLNLLWFVLASGIELALVGYLLWRWPSSAEKDMALARFYHFQGTGLLMLLAGAVILGWAHADAHGGRWSFDLAELAGLALPGTLGSVVFFLMFYGLAVRTPLFPLHGWLPVVAQHGNIAVGPTFLLGVKVGIYGLVRFVFPLLPEAVAAWNQYAVGFAVAGVFYAAFLAFMQKDLRRMMAFAVVSHTSLLVIGLFTLHPSAFQGALLLAVNFGLAATTLLFTVGLVYRRTRSTELSRLGGLFDRLPLLGIAFLVSGLAIVGMPGTPGFDAAHLVLEASIARYGALLTVASALGNVLAAGFLLLAFQRAFLAPRPESLPPERLERATPMENAVAAAVILLQLAAGFYLEPWLDLIEAPLAALAAQYGGH
jgi:NADH-quinone oxidoreductase subunit M